ncbi:exodeoxyribonuclease V subunit gamma [Kribbia dieselivorans]|uniref:exodeoxyribonuclease V subunit gamma n=1 Tax=Kribbia dieselivorans TaxID=331526 RepID=UPI000837CAEC|nr:exodeoxyribonuclease V subunit gamma [Kribbia dieselivorans]
MPIVVHRSDRPEALADGLAGMLRDDPGDVFDPAWVIVPAQGVERWLTQRLSHTLGATTGSDGVTAGLELRSPASLVSLLLGRERDDPWLPERLVWPTLAAIDASLGTPGFEALTRHLGGTTPERREVAWLQTARQNRRYAVARRLASLFAAYARERPAMLTDWQAGGQSDGHGEALDADLTWQPPLWRRVLAEVADRTGTTESPSARHARVVSELRSGSVEFDVPHRLNLFGHTRLSTSDVDLITALATAREVHLWLPHPSPALWEALAEPVHGHPRARADDDSARRAGHPLLATLGRDIRELEQTLLAAGIDETPPAPPHPEPTGAPFTRLALLQSDIRANRAPERTRPLADDDRSIQIHSCHGRGRQVEVLREVLTQLFEDDPTLQPRDVLVLTPDVEEYAPLIRAAFGGTTERERGTPRHPGHQLRVQVADRRLAATNPLIDLAQILVTLVAGRVTASDVLGLATHPAVARRFTFSEDDLATLSHWVATSGARWGLDAVHRAEYGLRDIADNTWTGALDRIALGVAVAADSPAEAAHDAPIDDIGSNDIALVGRFLELLDRVRAAVEEVRAPRSDRDGPLDDTRRRTVREWTTWLSETVIALGEVPRDDAWQRAQFEAELATIAECGGDLPLRLTDIDVMLGHRWGPRPTRANFRTGSLTVCTMVPMRSIPHRVVAVLGVDDGAFPRSPVVDGDDVLARRPRIGERDPRSEDRQLLLDALMSASDHFIALYSGHDEHTGARRPPAVPLQELISAAARTGQVPEAGEDFVRVHPLQAFDPRNFEPGAPIAGGSFDRAALEGAQALRAHRASGEVTRPLFVPQPLAEVPIGDVSLDDLAAFFEHPGKHFSVKRLGVTLPREDDEPSDHIAIDLDGLESWQVGDRVLRAVLDGGDAVAVLDREQRAGSLPPAALGGAVRQQIASNVASIIEGVDRGARRTIDVRIDLPSGTRVSGVVGGVIDGQPRLTFATYSKLSPKHEIAAWVRLLALAVAEPQTRWSAELTGRSTAVHLVAPPPEMAQTLIDELVGARRSGLRFPLALPPKTGQAFARQAVRGPEHARSAWNAAQSEWAAGRFPERDDKWWTFLLGPDAPIERLDPLGSLPYWAPRVWGPILRASGGGGNWGIRSES